MVMAYNSLFFKAIASAAILWIAGIFIVRSVAFDDRVCFRKSDVDTGALSNKIYGGGGSGNRVNDTENGVVVEYHTKTVYATQVITTTDHITVTYSPSPAPSRVAADKFKADNVFPKRLWQYTTNSLDDFTRDKMNDWRFKNPQYRHEIMTDQSANIWVTNTFSHRPDIVELYLALQVPILKADILRYLILIAEGGIYSDLDVGCEIAADYWIPARYMEKAALVVGLEFDIGWRGEGSDLGSQFASWTVMAKPGSPHLMRAVDDIVAEFHQIALENNVKFEGITFEMISDVVDVTGPKRLTRSVVASVADELGVTVDDRNISQLTRPTLIGDLIVLPNNAFAAAQGGYPEGQGPALVTHYYAGSWKRPKAGEEEEKKEEEKEETDQNNKDNNAKDTAPANKNGQSGQSGQKENQNEQKQKPEEQSFEDQRKEEEQKAEDQKSSAQQEEEEMRKEGEMKAEEQRKAEDLKEATKAKIPDPNY